MRYGHILLVKHDFTYSNARVQWNPKSNLLYHFCWEHSLDVNLVYDNIKTIDNIADKVKKGELHIPKEIFVLGFSGFGKTFIMPGLLWPICSHSNIEEQQKLIQMVVKMCAGDDGFHGDACRPQFFVGMIEKDIAYSLFVFICKGFNCLMWKLVHLDTQLIMMQSINQKVSVTPEFPCRKQLECVQSHLQCSSCTE